MSRFFFSREKEERKLISFLPLLSNPKSPTSLGAGGGHVDAGAGGGAGVGGVGGGIVGVVAGGVGAGLGGGGGGASGGGCGGGLGASFVEYDCDTEDEAWLRNLNSGGQERMARATLERLLWRLELLNADATDGALSGAGALAAERASAAAAATVDHLPKRDAVAALSQASGLRPGILARVYDHWRRKRSRRGRPLLRRLAAPTPAADTNPFHVFRPRERANRPQTRRRREGGDDGRERLLALSANLRKASELLELVAKREARKRALIISEAALQVLAVTLRHEPAGPLRDAVEADVAASARSRPLKRPACLEPKREEVTEAQRRRGGTAGPPIESSEQRRVRLRKRASAARQSVNAVALMPPRPPPSGPRMLFAEPVLETNPKVLEAVKKALAAKAAEAAEAEAAAAAAAANGSGDDDDDDDDDESSDDEEGSEDGDEAEEMDVTRCDATDAAEDVSIAGGRATRRALKRGKSSEKSEVEEEEDKKKSATATTKGKAAAAAAAKSKPSSSKPQKQKKNKKKKKKKATPTPRPPPAPLALLELPPPGLPEGSVPRIGRCGRLLWFPPPSQRHLATLPAGHDEPLPPPLWAKPVPAAAPAAAAAAAPSAAGGTATPAAAAAPAAAQQTPAQALQQQQQRFGTARPGTVTSLAQLRANAEAAAAAAAAAQQALEIAKAEEEAAKERTAAASGKKGGGEKEAEKEEGEKEKKKEKEEGKDGDAEMEEAK